MDSKAINKEFSLVPVGQSPDGYAISFCSGRKSDDGSEWSFGGFLIEGKMNDEVFLNVRLDTGAMACLSLKGLEVDDVLTLARLLSLSKEVE